MGLVSSMVTQLCPQSPEATFSQPLPSLPLSQGPKEKAAGKPAIQPSAAEQPGADCGKSMGLRFLAP